MFDCADVYIKTVAVHFSKKPAYLFVLFCFALPSNNQMFTYLLLEFILTGIQEIAISLLAVLCWL